MVVNIKWTKRAKRNFDDTVQYIENEWVSKSAQKFVRKLDYLLQTLRKYSKIGKIEIKEKGIRSFVFPDKILFSTGLKKIR
jgi:plasmid stabilization system protein ParE